MPTARVPVTKILDHLESHYGAQKVSWPIDPYEVLVWWHCGYPASDARCSAGWSGLRSRIGTQPEQILSAPAPKLTAALKGSGMVPELRAVRLKEIAARVQNEAQGDLRSALAAASRLKPDALCLAARKLLKKFPGISDPGADRILLFAGLAPIAAVPSNCPHVLVRLRRGIEHENYGTTYKEAQQEIDAGVPATLDARQRAFLLLKHHGQEICTRTKPKCESCPVSSLCAYFAGKRRGRSTAV